MKCNSFNLLLSRYMRELNFFCFTQVRAQNRFAHLPDLF